MTKSIKFAIFYNYRDKGFFCLLKTIDQTWLKNECCQNSYKNKFAIEGHNYDIWWWINKSIDTNNLYFLENN